MKLVASIQIDPAKGDRKTINSSLDLGDAPDAQLVQHSLHQMLGQLTNMLGLHQGGTFVSLSVATE